MQRPAKPRTPVQFRPRPPIPSPGHRPFGHVPGKPAGARKAGFRRGFRCHELRLTDAPTARLRDAARMAKLVNAGDLKSLIREDLSVRFRLRAPPSEYSMPNLSSPGSWRAGGGFRFALYGKGFWWEKSW